MIDSHAHLALCEPPDAELVAAARARGVRRILTVGLDAETNAAAVAAAEADDAVFACVGRHPNSARGFDAAAAAAIEELARHERVVAIGETGLDYYRDHAGPEEQRAAFSAQIGIARRARLPLVIHMRDRGDGSAVGETLATLAEEAEGVTVVLHCYSGPPERVADAAERGWYVSFAGNLTYPSAGDLREAACLVPPELLLVETDSPFLAPQSERGRPNEPGNVVETAERLAEERAVPYAELESQVEANAARAFGW
jgi:TatD DNase family protein